MAETKKEHSISHKMAVHLSDCLEQKKLSRARAAERRGLHLKPSEQNMPILHSTASWNEHSIKNLTDTADPNIGAEVSTTFFTQNAELAGMGYYSSQSQSQSQSQAIESDLQDNDVEGSLSMSFGGRGLPSTEAEASAVSTTPAGGSGGVNGKLAAIRKHNALRLKKREKVHTECDTAHEIVSIACNPQEQCPSVSLQVRTCCPNEATRTESPTATTQPSSVKHAPHSSPMNEISHGNDHEPSHCVRDENPPVLNSDDCPPPAGHRPYTIDHTIDSMSDHTNNSHLHGYNVESMLRNNSNGRVSANRNSTSRLKNNQRNNKYQLGDRIEPIADIDEYLNKMNFLPTIKRNQESWEKAKRSHSIAQKRMNDQENSRLSNYHQTPTNVFLDNPENGFVSRNARISHMLVKPQLNEAIAFQNNDAKLLTREECFYASTVERNQSAGVGPVSAISRARSAGTKPSKLAAHLLLLNHSDFSVRDLPPVNLKTSDAQNASLTKRPKSAGARPGTGRLASISRAESTALDTSILSPQPQLLFGSHNFEKYRSNGCVENAVENAEKSLGFYSHPRYPEIEHDGTRVHSSQRVGKVLMNSIKSQSSEDNALEDTDMTMKRKKTRKKKRKKAAAAAVAVAVAVPAVDAVPAVVTAVSANSNSLTDGTPTAISSKLRIPPRKGTARSKVGRSNSPSLSPSSLQQNELLWFQQVMEDRRKRNDSDVEYMQPLLSIGPSLIQSNESSPTLNFHNADSDDSLFVSDLEEEEEEEEVGDFDNLRIIAGSEPTAKQVPEVPIVAVSLGLTDLEDTLKNSPSLLNFEKNMGINNLNPLPKTSTYQEEGRSNEGISNETGNFFDPSTSTSDKGKLRVNNPRLFDAGSIVRVPHRDFSGITLLYGNRRNSNFHPNPQEQGLSPNLELITVLFDRREFSESQASHWWKANQTSLEGSLVEGKSN